MREDRWLAVQFGHPVFQLNPHFDEGPIDFQPGADARSFYYAKVPTRHIASMAKLVKAGFRVVDVSVMFEREASASIRSQPAAGLAIREVERGDEEKVLSIAYSSFIYSRFHLDPLIPREVANRIKREWIRSYVNGDRGERLLVAYMQGEPAGFLADLAGRDGDQAVRIIDLIAVNASRQGEGVGRSLVNHFISDCSSKCDLLRVGTQVANVPSVRLYESCGFRLSASHYVLHGHFQNGTACA